jgi:hypothetical protein
VIKFLDDSTIGASAKGDSITYGLAETLEKLEKGDAFAGLELLLWGVIAAYREQTQLMRDQVEHVRGNAPNFETIFDLVAEKLPGMVDSLAATGGGDPSQAQIFPKASGDAADDGSF